MRPSWVLVCFASLTTSADVTLFAVAAKDGESSQSFQALLMEVEKMRRYGFTDSELERAKTNYLRGLERAAENAPDRMNAELVRPMINHFAYNQPILILLMNCKLPKGTCRLFNWISSTKLQHKLSQKKTG